MSIVTVPEIGSISFVRIFIKVDFPEPFAPINPYLFLFVKDTVIFSKRGSVPNCIVMLLVEIIVVVVVLCDLEKVVRTDAAKDERKMAEDIE